MSEIGGRIVEREVSIFTDAEKGEIERGGGKRTACLVADGAGIVAREQVDAGDARRPEDVLGEQPAESRRMLGRQAHVLVELKDFDACPVDAGKTHEVRLKLNLRGGGGDGDSGDRLLGQDAAKGGGGRAGGGDAHRGASGVDEYLH